MKQRTDPKTWINIEDDLVPLSVDEFPDGSFRFSGDFSVLDFAYPVQITLKSTLPEVIVAIHQVVDAIQEYAGNNALIELHIQTFPDQRADRVEKDGQSVPARVSAKLIGALNVKEIYIYDAHSQVFVQELIIRSTAKVIEISAADCFEWARYETATELLPVDFVVAVDKGAKLRAETTAEQEGAAVIYADKKRVEGKVVGHEIVGKALVHPTDTIWVVDDLCDGGATFISIAKLLRETYKFEELNLYVTHGLFSKGKEELSKYFDNIIARFDYDQ